MARKWQVLLFSLYVTSTVVYSSTKHIVWEEMALKTAVWVRYFLHLIFSLVSNVSIILSQSTDLKWWYQLGDFRKFCFRLEFIRWGDGSTKIQTGMCPPLDVCSFHAFLWYWDFALCCEMRDGKSLNIWKKLNTDSMATGKFKKYCAFAKVEHSQPGDFFFSKFTYCTWSVTSESFVIFVREE